jgi:ssDNA-binding replication factor A large subunit
MQDIKITKLCAINEPGKKINVRVECEDAEISPHSSIRQKCIVADKTGRLEAVLWEKSYAAGISELVEGAWYEMRGVYTNEYNGSFSLSITSYSKIVRLADKPGQTTLA